MQRNLKKQRKYLELSSKKKKIKNISIFIIDKKGFNCHITFIDFNFLIGNKIYVFNRSLKWEEL